MVAPVSILVRAQRHASRLAGPEPWPAISPAPETVSGEVPESREREGKGERRNRIGSRSDPWFGPGGMLVALPGLSSGRRPPPALGMRPVEVRPAMVASCVAGTEHAVRIVKERKRGRKRKLGRERWRGGRLWSGQRWPGRLHFGWPCRQHGKFHVGDKREKEREEEKLMRERRGGWPTGAAAGSGPANGGRAAFNFGQRWPWPPALLRPLFRLK